MSPHRLSFAMPLLALGCGVSPAQPPAEPIPVPLVVSDYYSPDGFFGDGEIRGKVKLDKTCASRAPGALGDCYTITYTPGVKQFAGIFWQHPHNNWGDRPGHQILPGASRITLQVRGAAGQAITLGGGQRDSKPLHDSFQLEEVQVALSDRWTTQEVPFRGADYQNADGVIGAFMVSVRAGEGDAPIVFQLDDIRWTR